MNNLRKIIASLYIIAGQIDDLKKKYPNLPLNQIEHLKPKYYLWAVKQLIDNADITKLVPLLEQFDKTQSRLTEKDINKYKNLEQLNYTLNSLGESKTKIKTQTKTSGSKKLFENDKYLLLRIESKGACIQYGNNTKWCITEQDKDYFKHYSLDGAKFYYWINKYPENTNDPLNKVAVAVTPDSIPLRPNQDVEHIGKFYLELYNALDIRVKTNEVPGLPEVLPIILKDAESYKQIYHDINTNPENYTNDEYITKNEISKLFKGIWNNPEKYLNAEDPKIKQLLLTLSDKYPYSIVKLFESDNKQHNQIGYNLVTTLLEDIINNNSEYLPSSPSLAYYMGLVARKNPAKYIDVLILLAESGYTNVKAENIIKEAYINGLLDPATTVYREFNNTVKRIIDSLPPEILPKFIKNPMPEIRKHVIPSLPKEYLPELINDPNEEVRQLVTIHINPKYLPEIIKNDPSEFLRGFAEKLYSIHKK